LKNFLTMSLSVAGLALVLTGCQKKAPAAAAGGQGFPVQTVTVTEASVPVTSEYVATVKSRRSATLQPTVSGRLTAISVHSGEAVKAGQLLMEIDPAQQLAMVESAKATERQKKALYDYNKIEVDRQQKLFDAGVTSRDVYDQARQSYENTKSDYESAVEMRKTQEEQLAYFRVRAPFDGIVGDIPVHVGDYASPSTMLTTVDENKDLEAYIYLPTERVAEARLGMEVEILDTNGTLIEKSKINFLSPQVDNQLQGVLAKAPLQATMEKVRTAQLLKARVIWRNANLPTVPVLSIVRQGGQSFVFELAQAHGMTVAHQISVQLGDITGDQYAVVSGLKSGDKVIVSGTQFLVDGMPVIPLPPAAH
jgi:RND family efflux transporter MFP subunit